SLADRGFASFRGGVALREISLERLDGPKALRRGALGTKDLLCPVLESRAHRREAFLHLRDLSLLPLKLFALGRERPLAPPKVHLALPGFALRGAGLPIFRGQLPCEALHPFRRPREFLASAVEARVLDLEGFRVLLQLFDFRRGSLLAGVQLVGPSRERCLPDLEGRFAFRKGTVAVSELVLPLPQRLVASRQAPLPILRIPDSRFEALSGLRDFFHLGLEVRVEIVHLLPFAIEGRL